MLVRKIPNSLFSQLWWTPAWLLFPQLCAASRLYVPALHLSFPSILCIWTTAMCQSSDRKKQGLRLISELICSLRLRNVEHYKVGLHHLWQLFRNDKREKGVSPNVVINVGRLISQVSLQTPLTQERDNPLNLMSWYTAILSVYSFKETLSWLSFAPPCSVFCLRKWNAAWYACLLLGLCLKKRGSEFS